MVDLRNMGRREMVVSFSVVSDIVSCQAVTKQTVEMGDTLGQGGSAESPQRVQSCAQLGEEPFQLRVAIGGDVNDLDTFTKGVGLAAPRGTPVAATGLTKWARKLGQVSFAQSEFFWAGGGTPRTRAAYRDWQGDWMWTMAWKARFRRIRLDASPNDCPADTSSGGAGSQAAGALEHLSKLFTH